MCHIRSVQCHDRRSVSARPKRVIPGNDRKGERYGGNAQHTPRPTPEAGAGGIHVTRSIGMSCLLCLGFFAPGETRPPLGDLAFAQHLMLRAWQQDTPDDRGDLSARWPGAFPVMRLFAAKGDVDLVVLAGSSEATLALGPGHLEASALPGTPGNTVITGRRDSHFRFLADLAVDDSLAIETLAGRRHVYRIVDIDVVDARRARLVLDTPESTLTLVSAYPFDPSEPAAGMRYVVTAQMLF